MRINENEIRNRTERLNNALSKRGYQEVSENQYNEAFQLLEDIFSKAALGQLDSLIKPGLILAAHLRRLFENTKMPIPKALDALSMLGADRHLRQNKGEYLNQLYKCSLIVLSLGDVVTFAYCMDSMGLTYLDIHNTDQAWFCFQKQVRVYEKLGLKSELPRAYLHLAYAAKYWAMEGRLIWQSVNQTFENCATALNIANLSPEQDAEIRAAYYIDRVHSLIEEAKDDESRGLINKSDVVSAITEAKKSLGKGRVIAKKRSDLSHYVSMADQFEANVDLIELDYH